jgi:hypothetical protein
VRGWNFTGWGEDIAVDVVSSDRVRARKVSTRAAGGRRYHCGCAADSTGSHRLVSGFFADGLSPSTSRRFNRELIDPLRSGIDEERQTA